MPTEQAGTDRTLHAEDQPKLPLIERIGRILAVLFFTILFAAGIYAMEGDPPPDAPRGPSN